MNRAKPVLALLICLSLGLVLVLAACGGEEAGSAPANSPAANVTAGGQGNSLPPPANGPLVGANGQITVVAPPATGQNIPGQFFYVRENNIWESGSGLTGGQPLTTKDLGGKQITKATALALAQSPAISPDGSKMVYAFSPEPEGSPGNITIGQDLYEYDLKTSTNTLFIKRDDPQAFMDHPAWSQDGKYLYYDERSPRRDQSNTIVGETIALYRYDIATKKANKLAEDAREAAPLPGGKQVAFTGVSASNRLYEQELKLLDLPSGKITTLAGKDKDFLAIYDPQSSPDGQLIAFAASGGPGDPYAASQQNMGNMGTQPVAPPTPTPVTSLVRSQVGLLGLLPAPSTSNNLALHGVPYDLWVVKPDGTSLKRMTTLYEDQPMAAWSKDGQKIAFLAGLGLYTIDSDGKNLTKLSEGGAHGGFDWRN